MLLLQILFSGINFDIYKWENNRHLSLVLQWRQEEKGVFLLQYSFI